VRTRCIVLRVGLCRKCTEKKPVTTSFTLKPVPLAEASPINMHLFAKRISATDFGENKIIIMSHNIFLSRNTPGLDDGTERTALTVDSNQSTVSAFGTLALDSVKNSGSQQKQKQQKQKAFSNGSGDDEFESTTAIVSRSSLGLLQFFVLVAFLEGIIHYHYEVWWGVGMNFLLVVTGIASFFVAHRTSSSSSSSWETAKTVHFATTCVWFASAMVGLVLFGFFVVFRGRENLFRWCLVNSRGNYMDSTSITMTTCAALSKDGMIERIWITTVFFGVALGFPFMFLAVRTVYTFYAEAAFALAASSPLSDRT